MAKRTGRHPDKALTAATVRSIKEPGRYTDGNGLYLIVDPSGARRWVLRTVVQGVRRDIGLGGSTLVSLAEAREKALELRKLARSGGDPLAERRKAALVVPTFEEAAKLVHEEQKPSWKNKKHAQQWMNTLAAYAFPSIGSMRVDGLATPDMLRVLGPIWLTKPETARRVRQRLGTVMDWAKAAGFRQGDNPIDGVAKGLPKQHGRDGHHAAMPFSDVPAFVAKLRTNPPSELSAIAFELLILTACRTSEVLEARWAEFDARENVWTIPAERMKVARAHRIPLSARGADLIARARQLSLDSEFVFPGRVKGRPLSNMVFVMTLRRMKLDVTAHGFRSSFRDWAAETTNFPREVAEMALAHTVENKVEAAYRRGDLLDKRRDLMGAWAAYIEG
jgi:integrase